jgi:hypothetical protein
MRRACANSAFGERQMNSHLSVLSHVEQLAVSDTPRYESSQYEEEK